MSGGPTTTTNSRGSSTQTGTTALNTSGLSSLNGSTGPLAASMPLLSGILSSAKGINLNPNITPTESAAYSGLQGATNTAAGLNPAIAGAAGSQLAGGGVGANNGYITGALDKSNAALSPYLGTSFLDPSTNPYLAPAISALNDQITNQTRDAFAGSGRFGASGDFTKANSLGLANAEMPLLLGQFNTNAGLQQGAANSMAGNNISGAGALDQSAVARAGVQNQGAGMIPDLYGPGTTALQAANMQTAQPWTNLGYASQFLTPLAALGSTSAQSGTTSGISNGTQTSQGTQLGRSVTTQQSNPLQTALGGGLGLLGLLSMGQSGGLMGGLGSSLGRMF